MKKRFKVTFTGGGTGGHIFPLVSVIRELKKTVPEELLEIEYIGPQEEIAREYIENKGIKVKYIYAGKLRRYFTPASFLQNIVDVLFKIPVGIIQSSVYMFKSAPDLVFSKGGYGSLPAVISAYIFRTPVFFHESDIIPGTTNKLLQKIALETFVSFQDTKGVNPKKKITVGNPIREGVTGGDKEKAIEMFSLTREKPVILVLGGSQGSNRVNELILSGIGDMLEHFEIIHQCGKENIDYVSKQVEAVVLEKEKKKYYHPYSFFDEEKMRNAYAVADLVVSRAGSGSIFEISANEKPSILLPLPEAAQDHQTKNAYYYADTGAAIVMEEQNLTPHFFLEKLKQLFSPREQLRVMSKRAAEFYNPKSAKIIASYIKEYLKR